MRARYLIEVLDFDSDGPALGYVNNGNERYVGQGGFCVRSEACEFDSLEDAEGFIREHYATEPFMFAIQEIDSEA